MTDEMQRRYDRVNHEAGHAVAMHLLSHPIREIDCDHPRDDAAGWCVPEKVDVPLSQVRRWGHELAVILRVGSLATNTDWLSKDCASDRAGVRKIAGLLGIPPDAFEAIVTLDAEDLLRDPRFDPLHRALCCELRDHLHEVMPGDRAHAIMQAAIAAA